jgi:hypothetical protein
MASSIWLLIIILDHHLYSYLLYNFVFSMLVDWSLIHFYICQYKPKRSYTHAICLSHLFKTKKKQFFTNSSLYTLWSINEYPNEIKRIWWWRWINLLPVNKKKSSWHCFYCFLGFGDFGAYSSDPFTSTSSPIGSDPDVDWSVFENAGMTITHLKSILSFFSSS